MWRDLEQLPSDIVAEHILSWLLWKDVVVLSTATVKGLGAWSESFRRWSEPSWKSRWLHPGFEQLKAVRWAARNSCPISKEHLRADGGRPEVAAIINQFPALFVRTSVRFDKDYSPNSFTSSVLAGIAEVIVLDEADPEHSRVLANHCHCLERLRIYGRHHLQHLPQILSNNGQLNSLAIRAGRLQEGDPAYRALVIYGGQLRMLDLNAGTCDLSAYTSIAQACCNLRELTFNYRMELLDAVLEAFARACPLLEKMSLGDLEGLTSKGVEALARHCKALHTFEFPNLERLGPGCEYLKVFAHYGTPLRQITIYGDRGEQWGTAAQYKTMFSHVRELHCSLKGTAAFLVEGVRYMGQLQELDLWSAFAVYEEDLPTVDAILSTVAQHCRQLTVCRINFGWAVICSAKAGQATIDALAALIRSCPLLRTLSLHVSTMGIFSCRSLSPLTTALSGCLQLRDLCLREYIGSDTDLVPLFTACHHLEKVEIASRRFRDEQKGAVTDLTVHALAEHCYWLKTLSLVRYPAITGAALVELVRKCRKLHYLSVSAECATEDTATQLKAMKGSGKFHLMLRA